MIPVLILWGEARAKLIDEWGTEPINEETVAGFLEEYPDTDGVFTVYEFETEAEANAFRKGVTEADGWMDFAEISEPRERELVTAILKAKVKEEPKAAEYVDCLKYLETQAPAPEPHPFTEEDQEGLDDLVHHLFSEQASRLNNQGIDAQVAYLRAGGMSIEDIRKTLV